MRREAQEIFQESRRGGRRRLGKRGMKRAEDDGEKGEESRIYSEESRIARRAGL